MDLSEIPTEELVHEVQRRLECLSKPEKRLILIGAPGGTHLQAWACATAAHLAAAARGGAVQGHSFPAVTQRG